MISLIQQVRWSVVFLVTLTVIALFAVTSVSASGFNCGLMPLPPLGCSRADARCECDEEGNCRWVFDC
jgi:hypothetical protein